MRKRLQLTSVFFAALIVVQVVTAIVFHSAPVSAQSAAYTRDLDRRRLDTFLQCLEDRIIDTDDDLTDWGDLFDPVMVGTIGGNEIGADEAEVIVVGIDRESGNGVMNCTTVIRQGIEALDPGFNGGNQAAQDWLLNELTGTDFSETDSIDNGPIGGNLEQLRNRVRNARNEIGNNPPDDLVWRRFLPLAEMCYTIEQPPTRQATGDNFRVSMQGGQAAFYLKDLDDDDIPFLSQHSGVEAVTIGDLELGFASSESVNSSIGSTPGDWHAASSDFYPIGSDIGETEGYTRDAIVDCQFVKDHAEEILGDFGVDDEGNIIDPATGEPPTGDGADAPAAAADDEKDSCESEGAELSWVLCPILFALDKFIGGLDEAIQNMLIIPNSYIENQDLRQAWGYLRNIAYTVLVPIMLVMVLGTALGFEFFSAYTVKRALPRLIAAVLFITVSWQLMTFLVVLVNNVGLGLGGIIARPFGGIDNITLASIMAPSNAESATLTTGTVFAGLLAFPLLVANIPVLLSLAFTTAVGLLIGFVLLSFRQLLVMSLLLLAPLAILAWIFPGNDKLWKLWWGTFSKLLFLFPLIMILIASGRALAQVTSDIEGSLVGTVIKIIAYVGPYFMIPAMFKFAGGLFANIAGMTNDKTRGFFDKAREKRQATTAQNMAKWKTGSLRYGSDRSRFSRGLQRASNMSNSFGANVATGSTGLWGLRRGVAQQRMDQAKEERAVGDVMRDARWQSISQNGDALRAGTYETERDARAALTDLWTERDAQGNVIDTPEARARTAARVDDAVDAFKATGYRFGDRAAQLANARAMFSTGTDYDDVEDAAGVIARVSHGSMGLNSSTAGFGNFETKRAGRPDLAPGYANLRDASLRAGAAAGGDQVVGGPRAAVAIPNSEAEAQEQLAAAELAATRSVDTIGRLRGKGAGVQNDARVLTTALDAGVERLEAIDETMIDLDTQLASGTLTPQQEQVVQNVRTQTLEERRTTQENVKRVLGQIDEYDNNISYGSDENQQTVRNMVDATAGLRDRALGSLTGGAVQISHQMGPNGPERLITNPTNPDPLNPGALTGQQQQNLDQHQRDIDRYANTRNRPDPNNINNQQQQQQQQQNQNQNNP